MHLTLLLAVSYSIALSKGVICSAVIWHHNHDHQLLRWRGCFMPHSFIMALLRSVVWHNWCQTCHTYIWLLYLLCCFWCFCSWIFPPPPAEERCWYLCSPRGSVVKQGCIYCSWTVASPLKNRLPAIGIKVSESAHSLPPTLDFCKCLPHLEQCLPFLFMEDFLKSQVTLKPGSNFMSVPFPFAEGWCNACHVDSGCRNWDRAETHGSLGSDLQWGWEHLLNLALGSLKERNLLGLVK